MSVWLLSDSFLFCFLFLFLFFIFSAFGTKANKLIFLVFLENKLFFASVNKLLKIS